MRRGHGVLVLLLVMVLVFGLALGMNQAWAQEEEEEEELQPKGGEDRPNPMERTMGTTDPALLMKNGSTSLDPLSQTGTSGQAMRPGEEVMDDGQHDDGFVLKDGRRGIVVKGADGKMQLFLLKGKGKVLAPDGSYQLTDGSRISVKGGQALMPIDPLGSSGAVKSPGQVQIPGKMR